MSSPDWRGCVQTKVRRACGEWTCRNYVRNICRMLIQLAIVPCMPYIRAVCGAIKASAMLTYRLYKQGFGTNEHW